MTDRITEYASDLEREAQFAAAKRYAPGEIGYHSYTRRYLAEIAARLRIELEDHSTPTGADTSPPLPEALALSPEPGDVSAPEGRDGPDRAAHSHANRGAA